MADYTYSVGGGCGCGGCFTEDTLVDTNEGEKEIGELQKGEEVFSYNPDSGSENVSSVNETFEFERGGYYNIRTKDGREVKVTAEHPFFAIKKEQEPPTFWEYMKEESLTAKLLKRLLN
jgi:hypothetical protein